MAWPISIAALLPLDHLGHYLHWHWFLISVANLTVIVLMVVTFVAARSGAADKGLQVGLVITAYEQRTRPGQIEVRASVDLTPARYRTLRAS